MNQNKKKRVTALSYTHIVYDGKSEAGGEAWHAQPIWIIKVLYYIGLSALNATPLPQLKCGRI